MFSYILGFKPHVRLQYSDDLRETLDYQRRLANRLDPEVESSAGLANPCTFIADFDRCGKLNLVGEVGRR